MVYKVRFFMLAHDFVHSSCDDYVYIKSTSVRSSINMFLYIGDMLVARISMLKIEAHKEILSSEFNKKYLGDANKIICLDIVRDRKIVSYTLVKGGIFKNFLDSAL